MLCEIPMLIDVSKIKLETISDMEWLDSFKGSCTCDLMSVPETAYCLEGHTPRLQLHAKYLQYKNYPTSYDYLFYGDVSN